MGYNQELEAVEKYLQSIARKVAMAGESGETLDSVSDLLKVYLKVTKNDATGKYQITVKALELYDDGITYKDTLLVYKFAQEYNAKSLAVIKDSIADAAAGILEAGAGAFEEDFEEVAMFSLDAPLAPTPIAPVPPPVVEETPPPVSTNENED